MTRLPDQRREHFRAARVVAALASLVINGAVFYYLLPGSGTELYPRSSDAWVTLEAVWIEEKPDAALPTPELNVSDDNSHEQDGGATHVNLRHAVTTPTAAITEYAALEVEPGPGQVEPLDLSIPSERLIFGATLLHGGPDFRAPRPGQMKLEFRDQSLGGKMQRWTKTRTCGELHARLSRHPGSTSSIMNSMARLGC